MSLTLIVANAGGATVTVVPTPNSSTILKSSAATKVPPFPSTLNGRLVAAMLGILLYM